MVGGKEGERCRMGGVYGVSLSQLGREGNLGAFLTGE